MTDTIPARNPDGTFPVGVSGNPAGRPVGRKNQITVLKQALEIAVRDSVKPQRIINIVEKMCALAEEGHVGAAKVILDKVLSNAKEEDEASSGTGTFVFKVTNLTLKHSKADDGDEAIDGEFVEVQPPVGEDTVSTGADKSKQTAGDQSGGGNLVGKAPSAPLRKVPAFQGKSGQPDNQSTNRGSGGK